MSLPINGFTAIPNPQMLAFMAAQSFVMMMQAGEGWQYGKRKQSAMTNEEFNKQTPLTIMERQMSELKQAIPSIERSMNNMTPMVGMIVEQYGDFMKEIIAAAPEAIKNATQDLNIPFAAYGDTGVPNQKTFAASNEVDWIKVLSGLAGAITGMGGGVPGPNRNITETDEERIAADLLAKNSITTSGNTFLDIDKINPPTNIPIKVKHITPAFLNPADQARADHKAALAASGLSPAAFNAVNTFKSNIDKQSAVLDKLVKDLTWMNDHISHGRNLHFKPLVLNHKTIKIPAAVKKLGALRTKFRSTYGYYY